tara:strand:- start:319 stop:1104 length:786 start_codon:yes stop_codon:yes gene_type:complete
MKDDIKVKPLISGEEFEDNYQLDISDKIETRGGGKFEARYLSWAHAIRLLKTRHPEIEVGYEYCEDGRPYFIQEYIEEGVTETQAYILVYLSRYPTSSQKTRSIFYPVMDKRFDVLIRPNLRAISDALLRAAVKAIAFHTGIGLPLYTGEDLPDNNDIPKTNLPKKHVAEVSADMLSGDWRDAVMPVGKDKGKKLSELSERTLQWWHKEYDVNTAYPDSIIFRKALDDWSEGVVLNLEEGGQAELEQKVADQKITNEEVPF